MSCCLQLMAIKKVLDNPNFWISAKFCNKLKYYSTLEQCWFGKPKYAALFKFTSNIQEKSALYQGLFMHYLSWCFNEFFTIYQELHYSRPHNSRVYLLYVSAYNFKVLPEKRKTWSGKLYRCNYSNIVTYTNASIIQCRQLLF